MAKKMAKVNKTFFFFPHIPVHLHSLYQTINKLIPAWLLHSQSLFLQKKSFILFSQSSKNSLLKVIFLFFFPFPFFYISILFEQSSPKSNILIRKEKGSQTRERKESELVDEINEVSCFIGSFLVTSISA